jgi:hypothetical protein
MTNKNRFLYILIILGTIIITGFSRDFIFKSINGLLKAWDSNQYYYLHPSISFLEKYDYNTLINLKWLLTICFSLFYLLITLFAVRFFFGKKKKYLFIVYAAYLSLICISGLSVLGGYLFNSTERMYEFARYLMGMAQSPLILMILIPLFKFMEKENINTH